MTRRRKSKAHRQILRKAVTVKPTRGGPVGLVERCPDVAAVIEDVIALRLKGEPTVRLSQLYRIIREDIPEFKGSFVQVRDYVHRRWGSWVAPIA